MSQHKYFVSKRQLSQDDKCSDLMNLINNEIQQLNKKNSIARLEAKKINTNLLSNLKSKIQNEKSSNSKLSQNSKVSQKSIQIKQNSQNSKISQNSTKSKTIQQNSISQLKKTIDSNKYNIKQKLNPQIIKLLLNKQTPTNIQTKTDNKVKSDIQKKINTPQTATSNRQKTQKSEGLKPFLPVSCKNQSSYKNLLKFQSPDDFDPINCCDEGLSDLSISNKSFQIQEDPYLKAMYNREKQYEIPQSYQYEFSKNQKQITNQIRAILLDWMQQVCMEYMWKRETYHLAQYYLDAYLLRNPNVKRNDLQLVGVTCLQIATKQEEISPPSINILRQATANIYQVSQINQMEINILNSLQYKLNPQTKNVWTNYFIIQWDSFMNENLDFLQKSPIYFRQPNKNSYFIFRELFQILDLSILDLKSLQFQPRMLIASMMYLVIGFLQLSKGEIYKNLNLNFEVISFNFNYFYNNFLIKNFNCELKDLIHIINYVGKFFEFEIDYEFPRGAKISEDNIIESHFEDFLAFQTYTNLNNNFIQKL